MDDKKNKVHLAEVKMNVRRKQTKRKQTTLRRASLRLDDVNKRTLSVLSRDAGPFAHYHINSHFCLCQTGSDFST